MYVCWWCSEGLLVIILFGFRFKLSKIVCFFFSGQLLFILTCQNFCVFIKFKNLTFEKSWNLNKTKICSEYHNWAVEQF